MEKRNNKSHKILVIEDVKDWMENIKTLIEKKGYLVIPAINFTSAREIIQSDNKDYTDLALILLDLKLPDGSGLDLMDLVFPRWERDKTRIVIVTSEGWVYESEKAQTYPFYFDYVSKNLDSFEQDLGEIINTAIKMREDES